MVTTEREASPASRQLLSGEKLAKLGVQIMNRFDLALKCMACGEIWSPRRTAEDKPVRGYWKCPNRCNW